MTLTIKVESEGKVVRTEHFVVDAGNPLTFGRAADHNRLQLPDEKKMISSKHGRIERREDGYYVVDLGSLNGTMLDGTTVPAATGALLKDGSCIGVGGFVLRVALAADKNTRVQQPNLDSTLFSFDPEQAANTAWEALCAQTVQQRRSPPKERRAAMLAELRRHLQRIPAPQARAVLKRVLQRTGTSEPPGAGGGAEELLQACCSELQRLAQSLVAGKKLTAAKDVTKFAQLVQLFFELTLRWVVQCMRARAEFEDEFGAEVTMVFQRSNNPLKGLAAEELGKSLLDWSGDRDAEAVRHQLESIYRDLTQHQLGILVGVKDAVAAVMERLSPEAIETLAQKQAGWLTSKDAKSWEVYRQIYREFLEEKSKLFHEIILPGIRRGYLTSHQEGQPKKPG